MAGSRRVAQDQSAFVDQAPPPLIDNTRAIVIDFLFFFSWKQTSWPQGFLRCQTTALPFVMTSFRPQGSMFHSGCFAFGETWKASLHNSSGLFNIKCNMRDSVSHITRTSGRKLCQKVRGCSVLELRNGPAARLSFWSEANHPKSINAALEWSWSQRGEAVVIRVVSQALSVYLFLP